MEVGYYNAATKIKNILVSIVTSLGTVLMPRTSYYIQQGMMDEFYRLSKKAIKFVLLIASAMMIYLKKDVRYLYSKQDYPKILAALLIAVVSAGIVKVFVPGVFIKLVISAVLFFGLYGIALYVMKEEIVTENLNKGFQMIKSHKQ